jgi:hypothetical protein
MAPLLRLIQASHFGLFRHFPQCLTQQLSSVRSLSCSNVGLVREISEKEEVTLSGKVEIVVEGFIKESDRRSRLINPPVSPQLDCKAKESCHPLCRLDFVHEIKHTGSYFGSGVVISYMIWGGGAQRLSSIKILFKD